jgi:23S rRNA (uridine2479-2'-O)-methyltransferase
MYPRTIVVHSANNHFQRAEVLRRNRQKRQHYGEFFIEGVLPINRALAHGWEVRAFFYPRERRLSDWASGILERSSARSHFELPPFLMEQLSDKTDTSELIAIIAMPPDQLSRIPIAEKPLIVVFDRPANPGNLGTLLRSCDALGADGLVVTGHGADLYDPETIRASMGSLFALPAVRASGPEELRSWLEATGDRAGGLQVVGSDENGTREVWEHDLRGPTILLVGNEKWGLSAGYRELCDAMVRIPIGGSATSLNVAAAASILLYEARRQRA